jgi:ureidoglycolate hydrolase
MEIQRKQLPVRLLTEEGFNPYGRVISLPEQEVGKTRAEMSPSRGRTPHSDSWILSSLDFDGRQGYMAWVRYFRRKLEFHTLERHVQETEVLIPMGGSPCIVAASARTEPLDSDVGPDPESVEAFFLDGSKGIAFDRGVWHRHVYPLGDYTDLAVVLAHHKDAPDSMKVDFLETHSLIFDLVLTGLQHSPDIIGEVVT